MPSGGTGVLLLGLLAAAAAVGDAAVSYNHRAVVINGQRRILMSGSIHYPRNTPEMWPDLIQKAKDPGCPEIVSESVGNDTLASPLHISRSTSTSTCLHIYATSR